MRRATPIASRTAARSRGPPRPKPRRGKARARSGAARSASVGRRISRRLVSRVADGIEPRFDCAPGRSAGSTAALAVRARRRPSPSGRWQQATSTISHPMRHLTSSRLARLAASMKSRRCPLSRWTDERLRAHLRQVDVFQNRADGRQLGRAKTRRSRRGRQHRGTPSDRARPTLNVEIAPTGSASPCRPRIRRSATNV